MSRTVKAWLIEFKFPSGSVMWFYESLHNEFCMTPESESATHFDSKLKAEEYLINLKYTNRGLEVIDRFIVTEHEFVFNT